MPDPKLTYAHSRPLVYLACPYSHPVRVVRVARFEVASRVAGRLMSEGLMVFSPISHTHPIAECCDLPGDWEYWEAYDRAFLSVSHALYVVTIPGWEKSTGVQAEIRIADEMGIPIYYINDQEAKAA